MTSKPRLAAALGSLALILALPPGTGEASLSRGSGKSMPDLERLSLRTDPEVHGRGRIIKGLYYVAEPGGPNALVAFFNACDRRMEGHPFLIFDFGTERYYFDADRDGRLDETGSQSGGIDPVPFAQRESDWSAYCYGGEAG
ncbi:hypothetical protein [Azospirillum sp. sgz302134]